MTKITRSTAAAVTAAAALLALSLPAGAFTVSQQGSSVWGGYGHVNTTVTWSGGSRGTQAGAFALKGDLNGTGVENFAAWCLDIGHTLGLPSEYSITTTPFAHGTISATVLAALQKLVNTGYSAVRANMTDNNTVAGFQMALWEVLDETSGSYDATAGNTKFTGPAGALTAANGFLAGMSGSNTGNYKLTYLQSESRAPGQSLVTISTVPVPAAGVLLLGALGGLGMFARRRKSTEA